MTTITRITGNEASAHINELVALLADAVNNGASVGFLRPLDENLGRAYWSDVVAAVATGSRILLVARVAGRIVGTVQLDLCCKQNGSHRAEVTKLLVLSSSRRRGLASKLMAAIEREGREAKRSLLFLDTESKSGAEPFYFSQQWQHCGSIPDYALSVDGVPTPNVIFYKMM